MFVCGRALDNSERKAKGEWRHGPRAYALLCTRQLLIVRSCADADAAAPFWFFGGVELPPGARFLSPLNGPLPPSRLTPLFQFQFQFQHFHALTSHIIKIPLDP